MTKQTFSLVSYLCAGSMQLCRSRKPITIVKFSIAWFEEATQQYFVPISNQLRWTELFSRTTQWLIEYKKVMRRVILKQTKQEGKYKSHWQTRHTARSLSQSILVCIYFSITHGHVWPYFWHTSVFPNTSPVMEWREYTDTSIYLCFGTRFPITLPNNNMAILAGDDWNTNIHQK